MSSRAGFSLLELLVALVLVGGVMSAAHSIVSTVVIHRSAAVRQMERAVELSVQQRTLSKWIREAILPDSASEPGFQGLDGSHGLTPDDRLVFYTPHTQGEGTRRIHLYIERSPYSSARGLVASISEPGLPERWIQLASEARGLDAQYLFQSDGQRWHTGWISSNILPVGVVLMLTEEDGSPATGWTMHPLTVEMRNAR